MASTHKLFIVGFVLALTLSSTANARLLSSRGATLGARLKVDGESSTCWESLFELQACTGEVIMFFLNGETYMGPSCCQAIRVVGHDCWPELLASLGFTTQESDILMGYCDGEQHLSPTLPSLETTTVRP